MFGMSLVTVMNAIYATEVLGVPEELWWLTFIPLLITMVIMSVPIGKSVDKIGRRIPLILGLIVFGVAAVFFTVGNLLTVMVSMALLSIGQLLVMTAAMALSTDLVDSENRGKVVGFRNFVGYVFTALGMLLGSFLYVSFAPQLPFYVAFVLMIPAVFIVLFQIKESNNLNQRIDNTNKP
jgi:MFS family permease